MQAKAPLSELTYKVCRKSTEPKESQLFEGSSLTAPAINLQ